MKNSRVKLSKLKMNKYVKDLPSTIFADIQYVDGSKNFLERESKKEDNISTKMWQVKSRRDINYSSNVIYKPLNHNL